MSVFDRGLGTIGFLPDEFRAAMRRRLREAGGLALLGLALMLALALASWSVQDPSLSHATKTPVRNLLGMPGAVVSDLLMQLLGVASVVLILPVAVWGWRLMTHRPLHRERIRLLFWIGGAVLAAAFASCLPRSAAWPLPANLGGVVGDSLLRFPAFAVGGSLNGLAALAVAAICMASPPRSFETIP